MISSRSLRALYAPWFVVVLSITLLTACGGGGESPSSGADASDVVDQDAGDAGGGSDGGDADVADDTGDATDAGGGDADAVDADADDTSVEDADASDASDTDAGDAGDAGSDADDAALDASDADTGDVDASDTSADADASDADAGDAGDVDTGDADPDASDTGDTDPDAGDTGDTDACTTNPCGGCEPLTFDDGDAAPGDVCGGPCGDGALVCDGLDALRCEAPPRNGCGGCDGLDGVPGESCGPAELDGAGRWRCVDPDAVACVGASTNACGGTAALDPPWGATCGDDGLGRIVCDGTDGVRCDDPGTNACGGITPLGVTPGETCGPCGAAWTCDGTDAVVCPFTANLCGGCEPLRGDPGEMCAEAATFACTGPDTVECIRGAVGACDPDVADDALIGTTCGECGDGFVGCTDGVEACIGASAPNACGGCGPLPGTPTERCSVDATWQCTDDGTLACDGPLGAIGDPCVDDASCASSLCTRLATHSDLQVCAEYCDPGHGALCEADEACFVLVLEDPTAAREALAACEDACAGRPDVFFCRAECAEAHPIASHARCLPTDRCFDGDGDGYGVAGSCRVDCDDREPLRNRDAAEVCDGLDNDCDGRVDETTDAELGCVAPDVCVDGACGVPEVCGAAGDEDGDGLEGCDDPDCADYIDCLDGGPCLNAYDLEAIAGGARGDMLLACYEGCAERLDLAGCAAECLADEDYVSGECAPCMGDWLACQIVACTDACADGGEDCIACRTACDDARDACGGLEAFEPCAAHEQPCSYIEQSTPNHVCNVARGVCLQTCAADVGTSCPVGAACVDGDRIDEAELAPRGVCLPGECAATYADTTCPDDATCVLASTRTASFCEAAGDVPAGGRCEVSADPGAAPDDRCAPGLLCLSNRCVEVCDARFVAPDPGCDDGLSCVGVFAASDRNAPGVCAPACDAWSEGACDLGEACVPNRGEPGAREAFYCAPVDTPGGDGTPCALGDQCAEGFVCTERADGAPTCRPICDVADPDVGPLADCDDGAVCLSAEVGRLGLCHDGCEPFADDRACGDDRVCQPQRVEFRYAPDVGACVPANDGAAVGEPCNRFDGAGCAGTAACVPDPLGADPAIGVCAETCDPFAPTCGRDEVCAFVPAIAGRGASLGACVATVDAASAFEPCASPAGAACRNGGGCYDLGDGPICLQACRIGGDDCPAGRTCDSWIDWDGRPIDIGVCR